MDSENTTQKNKRLSNIMIENRRKLTASGVSEVLNFTETAVSLLTSEGGLIIGGKNIKISKFSVEEGVLIVEGAIDSLRYVEQAEKKGFLKRLIK